MNFNSTALNYFIAADGSEWLGLGGHGLLLRTKEGAGPPVMPPAGGSA